MPSPRRPVRVITPPRRWTVADPRDLIAHRDLLVRFTIRDLTLRYRQTLLGVGWVILLPLIAAGAFAVVFGRIAGLDSQGTPYFVLALAGMVLWTGFSQGVTRLSTSLVSNAALISKVYFPRLVLPVSGLGSVAVDLMVSLVMTLIVVVVNDIAFSATVLVLPVWAALTLVLASGIGLAAAALMVRYRDVQFVLPVVLQVLLYASPVAYSLDAVPADLRDLYAINPLTGLLEGWRWSLLGGAAPPTAALVSSVIWAVLALGLGAFVFARLEREFADVI
ncbi:MAG: ABC transporter permease [Actinomycetota bacterium]|nr:ABC transporter permease [Actinomycetota bacterium]